MLYYFEVYVLQYKEFFVEDTEPRKTTNIAKQKSLISVGGGYWAPKSHATLIPGTKNAYSLKPGMAATHKTENDRVIPLSDEERAQSQQISAKDAGNGSPNRRAPEDATQSASPAISNYPDTKYHRIPLQQITAPIGWNDDVALKQHLVSYGTTPMKNLGESSEDAYQKIVTGEAFYLIDKNPKYKEDYPKLLDAMCKRFENTKLAKEIASGVPANAPKNTWLEKFSNKDSGIVQNTLTAINDAILKHEIISDSFTKLGWNKSDIFIEHFYYHQDTKPAILQSLAKIVESDGNVTDFEGNELSTDDLVQRLSNLDIEFVAYNAMKNSMIVF